MPRIIYDPEDKAAFLKAVRETLRNGKSWDDAFQAARALSYSGTRTSLQKMYYLRKRPGRKKGWRAAASTTAGAALGGDLKGLQTALDSIVKERVRSALDRAIVALRAYQV